MLLAEFTALYAGMYWATYVGRYLPTSLAGAPAVGYVCMYVHMYVVSEAVDEFVRGSDPAELPWCVLRVIRRAGLLLSVDNRRLYAMKEAQRKIQENDPARGALRAGPALLVAANLRHIPGALRSRMRHLRRPEYSPQGDETPQSLVGYLCES